MKSAKMRKEFPELLYWLADHGCPVDIPTVQPTVRIDQAVGDDITIVLDLSDGRAGYILDLEITNEGPGPRFVRGVELQMEWSDTGFELLPDPTETNAGSMNLYRFPGCSIEYPPHMVLNHALIPNGILHPNHPKRGLLLGVGSPMSREIRHGALFTGELTLFFESGTSHTYDLQIRADRLSKPRYPIKKSLAAYDGLYGDKIRSGQAPENRPKPDFHDNDILDPASLDAVPDKGDVNKRRQ